MNMKFFNVPVGGSFFIEKTPSPSPSNPTPERVFTACNKSSAISYVDVAEQVLGEVGYDPDIADKIVTNEEMVAINAAITKALDKKKAALKKPVKKVVKNATPAKKPVKKASAKKATKKAAKKASKKR